MIGYVHCHSMLTIIAVMSHSVTMSVTIIHSVHDTVHVIIIHSVTMSNNVNVSVNVNDINSQDEEAKRSARASSGGR